MRLFSRWCEAAVNLLPAKWFLLSAFVLGVSIMAGLPVSPTFAEIIIDDFDDPVEVVSPAMEGELITTENIGELNATRTVLIYGGASNPEATLDVDLSTPSHLTANFIALNPPAGFPLGLGRVGFSYEMIGPTIDFTENAANNAILVEVASIGGPTPPPFFYALVQDGGDFFEAFFDLRTFSAPGTIALPFDRFDARAGDTGSTKFEGVSEVFFHVLSNGQLNGVEEQGWSIRIDRVRVGRMVPEPSTIVSITLMLSILGGFRLARSSSRDVEG